MVSHVHNKRVTKRKPAPVESDSIHLQWVLNANTTVRVQYQEPEAKTTEVEARVALICASTDDGRPLTGGLNLI